ncbi:hypothetical protein R1flu_017131 [Riccia fluitans]|uniref:Uncharacterized protein n=1 Tax=Riccia fluitans TaxID=41844 RepID=A0ABD1YP76_9MARC
MTEGDQPRLIYQTLSMMEEFLEMSSTNKEMMLELNVVLVVDLKKNTKLKLECEEELLWSPVSFLIVEIKYHNFAKQTVGGLSSGDVEHGGEAQQEEGASEYAFYESFNHLYLEATETENAKKYKMHFYFVVYDSVEFLANIDLLPFEAEKVRV